MDFYRQYAPFPVIGGTPPPPMQTTDQFTGERPTMPPGTPGWVDTPLLGKYPTIEAPFQAGGVIPRTIARAKAPSGTGRFGLAQSSLDLGPMTAVPDAPIMPTQSPSPLPNTKSTVPTAADVDAARQRAAAYFALGANAQGGLPLSNLFAAPAQAPVQQPQPTQMPRPIGAPIYQRLS